ncbi:MAG TPA: transcriptional regulator [Gallionella sp.]|nr:transcriptional regulator [Gallionella sp.]OGS68110.1 MAG: transcriptional regulator [Gallionellales bacterium GWA2_54_124]OGT19272.1 MAG: transcriptional regulator [Gallionellales bacterium RIFOXYD12_FULL_53_10]OGT25297.1 MAG: transcriptional regulator [Gallionellales bacterium RIFOXYD2_FULL_52_7]HCI53639.1 transcriptional regulator [Gallionella sp.]
MKLIEQDETDDFQTVLKRFNLSAGDFELTETDTTDPQTDEIFALTGFVVVMQKSTGLKMQYPIGDGSRWVEEFERDIEKTCLTNNAPSNLIENTP